MKRRIERVAVLGAGTMGARIAAHLANAGIRCFLLDIVPPELNADEKRKGSTLESPAVRNRIVLAGLEGAKKSRPAAFFTPETARLVTPVNWTTTSRGAARWIGLSRRWRRTWILRGIYLRAWKRCASPGRL